MADANTDFEKALTANPEKPGLSGDAAGETVLNAANGLGFAGETFDAALHMKAPFEAFLRAAEECAIRGWLVFMRPDDPISSGGWKQQLYILPQSSLLAPPEAV